MPKIEGFTIKLTISWSNNNIWFQKYSTLYNSTEKKFLDKSDSDVQGFLTLCPSKGIDHDVAWVQTTSRPPTPLRRWHLSRSGKKCVCCGESRGSGGQAWSRTTRSFRFLNRSRDGADNRRSKSIRTRCGSGTDWMLERTIGWYFFWLYELTCRACLLLECVVLLIIILFIYVLLIITYYVVFTYY